MNSGKIDIEAEDFVYQVVRREGGRERGGVKTKAITLYPGGIRTHDP
jgi:hypothetical protein